MRSYYLFGSIPSPLVLTTVIVMTPDNHNFVIQRRKTNYNRLWHSGWSDTISNNNSLKHSLATDKLVTIYWSDTFNHRSKFCSYKIWSNLYQELRYIFPLGIVILPCCGRIGLKAIGGWMRLSIVGARLEGAGWTFKFCIVVGHKRERLEEKS